MYQVKQKSAIMVFAKKSILAILQTTTCRAGSTLALSVFTTYNLQVQPSTRGCLQQIQHQNFLRHLADEGAPILLRPCVGGKSAEDRPKPHCCACPARPAVQEYHASSKSCKMKCHEVSWLDHNQLQTKLKVRSMHGVAPSMLLECLAASQPLHLLNEQA